MEEWKMTATVSATVSVVWLKEVLHTECIACLACITCIACIACFAVFYSVLHDIFIQIALEHGTLVPYRMNGLASCNSASSSSASSIGISSSIKY